MSTEDVLSIVRDMLHTTEYCFFITLNEFGGADARLMQPFPPQEDLTIWFATTPESRKVRHIQHNNRVTLTFLERSETAYVALAGVASVEDDPEECQQHRTTNWTAFFSDGPSSADYTLIKFVPQRIELMSLVRETATTPFGLLPITLMHTASGWQLVETTNRLRSYVVGHS